MDQYIDLVSKRLSELKNKLAHATGKMEIKDLMFLINQNETMILALEGVILGYPIRYYRLPDSLLRPGNERNLDLAVSA